jgi:hypothetical protein
MLVCVKEPRGRKLRQVCKQRTVYCVSVATSKVVCRNGGKETNLERDYMKIFLVWFRFPFILGTNYFIIFINNSVY